jgi:hypothetical protein
MIGRLARRPLRNARLTATSPSYGLVTFDAGRSAWGRGQGRMAMPACLDAGLLVGTEKVVLGAKGWFCQMPAYKSRIGPASSAKRGPRGKIQYLYRHGLMASVRETSHLAHRCRQWRTESGCKPTCAAASP